MSSWVDLTPVLVAISQSGQRRQISSFVKQGNWPQECLHPSLSFMEMKFFKICCLLLVQTIKKYSVTRIWESLGQASNMKERWKCSLVRTIMISVQYRTIAQIVNKTGIPNISMQRKRIFANVMCMCVPAWVRLLLKILNNQRTKQSTHRILFLELILGIPIQAWRNFIPLNGTIICHPEGNVADQKMSVGGHEQCSIR